MRRNLSGQVSRHIDSEVYQIITKLLKDEGSDLVGNRGRRAVPSVATVYESIQKSNSSIKRKPKPVIAASIQRILAALEEEGWFSDHNDHTSSGEELDRQAELLHRDTSNAMNRTVVKGFAARSKAKAGAAVPYIEPAVNTTSDGAVDLTENQPAPEKSEQRNNKRRLNQDQKPEGQARSLKRSKNLGDENATAPPTHVSFSDLGGMDDIIEYFGEHLLLPLRRPERYMERGLKIPRGILLHGPPGCGKTLFAEALAAELALPFISISAPTIVSGMSGESEKQLRSHFERAVSLAPCLMFIDEIDAISSKRENAQREMERRIVAQMLTCMDDLALEKTNGKPVLVLAATNRPDALDPALRRAGRFDIEKSIGIPTIEVREQILRAQLRRTTVADHIDFKELAKLTSGFVGADLESFVSKAGSVSNARYIKSLIEYSAQQADGIRDNSKVRLDGHGDTDMNGGDTNLENEDVRITDESNEPAHRAVTSFRRLNSILLSELKPDHLTSLDTLTMADFLTALPLVQPSSRREGFATIPDTTWQSVGALHGVRKQLMSSIVEPIRSPEKYARFGVSIPAGVLLWGPPGCGKTLLAKAVANESKANFISVKGPELLNKYVGESERAVRQVFFRAQSSKPTVIFFDELDALVPKRQEALSEASSRVVNTLLTELDGIGSRFGVWVIAATNRPDAIDPAMLRPGRLGKHLYVGLPDADARVEILGTLMRNMPTASPDLPELARKCNNFSGADLSSLVYEAAQHAIDRDADVLELADLEAAQKEVKPSVSDMKRYETLQRSLTRDI